MVQKKRRISVECQYAFRDFIQLLIYRSSLQPASEDVKVVALLIHSLQFI